MFTDLGPVIQTADGSLTLVCKDVDEPYHTRSGARLEAEELYIKSSGIVECLKQSDTVRVLDIGLGLGYNALATLDAWHCGVAHLDLVSFECDETLFAALRSGNAPWQLGWPDSWIQKVQQLQECGEGLYCADFKGDDLKSARWVVYMGDAHQNIEKIPVSAAADFIWQDPFSPKRAPQLWSAEWMKKLRERSLPGTVLMTYSVARVVKDALSQTHWDYSKFPSSMSAREWMRAIAT